MASRHEKGLLDTSTLLLLGRVEHPERLPEEPVISTITLAELTVGPLVAATEPERVARQAHLQQAESDFDALPFDAAAARAFGSVGTALRDRERKRSARAFDALIAAVAIANDLPVYTANPSDFEGIDDLEVIPVAIAEH